MIRSVKYQLLAQLWMSGRMLFVNWMANSCNYKFGILPLCVFILALFHLILYFTFSLFYFAIFFLSHSLKRIITNTINICMARDSLYVCLLSVAFLCGYLVFVYRLSVCVRKPERFGVMFIFIAWKMQLSNKTMMKNEKLTVTDKNTI